VKHGIARSRLQSAGLGQGKPIASNRTSEGRARNRRVEMVIVRRSAAAATTAENSANPATMSGSGLASVSSNPEVVKKTANTAVLRGPLRSRKRPAIGKRSRRATY